MSDDLLPYYERELKTLVDLGGDFAERHPQAASKLKLGAEGATDPHVQRLIEAVAFLNARVRRKLDDDFPELTQSLLGVLYPHYLRPIPSMGIVQFELDTAQHELFDGYQVPRGVEMDSEPDQTFNERCRYRTGYDTQLWPLKIASVKFAQRPFTIPPSDEAPRATSVLHLQLKTFNPVTSVSQLRVPSLRFYLHRGNNTNVYRLLELLFTDVLGICCASSPHAKTFITLPRTAITNVGFERDQRLLPDDPRTFPGYGLLTEGFAFPQKHLFFDLNLGDPQSPDWALRPLAGELKDTLEIFFLLKRGDNDLSKDVTTDTVKLGCTPIVNLFSQDANAFKFDSTTAEHRLVANNRRPFACEIYSIHNVEAVSSDGKDVVKFQPFFAFRHGANRDEGYWHASIRPGTNSLPGDPSRLQSDFYLSLVDLHFQPSQPLDWTIHVKTTCFSGDAPNRLPGGAAGGMPRPQFDLVDGMGPIGKLRSVAPPTETKRMDLPPGALWKLISHLSLNHLSLVEGDKAATALREILRLYNFDQASEKQVLVDSIIDVQTRPLPGRVGWRAGGFALGTQVTITLDETRLKGLGAYIMASLLDRFLAMYVTINSFTQLTVQSKQRLGQEEPWTWPKRAGEKPLL